MRSYEQVKSIFEENGCKLLDSEYKNSKTKMRYIAACGHEHEIALDNFLAGKGRVCKACRYKRQSESLKHSYEYVSGYFENEGCKLLDNVYTDASHTKIRYIARCGHENKVTFNKFVNGVGRICNKCSKSIKYDFDEVFAEFEKRGCTLLEDSYENCKVQMRYIATCGHESTVSFDELKNAKSVTLRCRKCQKINHYDLEDVKRIFEENGCKLLSTDYRISDDRLEYIAQCGHKASIKFSKFLTGQGRKCKKCCKPSGKDHWKFDENLTEDDRKARDFQNGEIRKFREMAFKRDNYTCQICHDGKGGNLEAHHLESWDANIEKRFDLNNLVTLCKDCHKAFHKEYGFGNNTKTQYNDFIKAMEIPRA